MTSTTDYLAPTYAAPAAAVDEDDEDLDDLLGEDEDADPAPGSAHVSTARGKAGASNKALIRRVANKAAELATAPDARKATLAAMLGCTTELSDLTYTVMSSDRSAMAAAADLTAIAEEDNYSAALVATAMGRPRMRAVWALLLTLKAGLPGTVPPSDVKAAIALAKACATLPSTTKDELSKVTALARKS